MDPHPSTSPQVSPSEAVPKKPPAEPEDLLKGLKQMVELFKGGENRGAKGQLDSMKTFQESASLICLGAFAFLRQYLDGDEKEKGDKGSKEAEAKDTKKNDPSQSTQQAPSNPPPPPESQPVPPLVHSEKSVEQKETPDSKGIFLVGSSTMVASGNFLKDSPHTVIGGEGLHSGRILDQLRVRQSELRGAECVVLQLGLNPRGGYKQVLQDCDEAIALCAKYGVKEVRVVTGYPFSRAMDRPELVAYGKALRDALAQKFGRGGQMEQTRIEFRDLYAPFGDSDGYLKPEYDEMRNNIHAPQKVMQEGLTYLLA